MVQIKTTAEIDKIAAAGLIVARVLKEIEHMVAPGVSTGELDEAARTLIRQSGAVPSFLGYGQPPFPAAICASVDAEVVHGIPDPKRRLTVGSIVSIDVGVYLDGYHADAARTFAVGTIEPAVARLVAVTEACFWTALAKAQPGVRIGDLSAAVQAMAEHSGYGVVRELTGHGIGRNLHEEPDLPNFGKTGHGMRLETGMVLAMEPMINLGSRRVIMLDDGWTIITADRRPSAHYENTFAITDGQPRVLTILPEDMPHGIT